ncbi:hypothetical protein B0T14DRAFT_563182 [Immersiella caudata]|uniref:Uncharacterized protein n=1 Tax=Immersiella caudata TaxID=314043 RepID=A0AA39X4X1_9PEZI|nr:hypothetical protein B0T14DRAFT_563182 [Immersiella caudata]
MAAIAASGVELTAPSSPAMSPDATKRDIQSTVTPRGGPWSPLRHRLRRFCISFRHHLSQIGNDWSWEFASTFLSIAATIAIVAVLSVYNHQKFPQVPGDISLNAVVATLSTVSKSSLIFSVS